MKSGDRWLGRSNITMRIGSAELELSAGRFAWFPKRSTLFIADLHLGKEAASRSGKALRSDLTDEILASLLDLISRYQPQRVIILGDLIHATSSYTEAFRRQFDRFWRTQRIQFPHTAWILVEGNHDKRAKRVLAGLPIEIVQPPWTFDELVCVHDPAGYTNHSVGATERNNRVVLAGHIHPAVRWSEHGAPASCFARQGHLLVFPAFHPSTRLRNIEPRRWDELYVVQGDTIVPIGCCVATTTGKGDSL